jgi:hypothetical protein
VGRKSDGDSLSQLLVALQNKNGAVHGAHNPKYVAAAMVRFIGIPDNSPDCVCSHA